MEKVIKKRMLAFVMACALLLTMFSGLSLAVHANASEIMPCYNNVSYVQSYVNISSSGMLTVTNTYEGANGKITKAVITTYIEKKVLGLFWSRVDIGTSDNQWVDTSYSNVFDGSHSVQLSSEGTYRVTAEYVIYGNGGSEDEIEEVVTKVY